MTFDPSDIVTGIVALLGGGSVASVVAGVAAFFIGRAFGNKNPPAARSDTRLQRLAFRAETQGNKRTANLFKALGENDRQGLAGWVDNELLVHQTVPDLVKDSTDRAELYGVLSTCEGVDVLKAIDEAKAKLIAPLVVLLLCLVLGSSAAAAGWAPERWEPTIEQPVIDEPTFAPRASNSPRAASQLDEVYTALGRPQGGSYESVSAGHSSCRAGFWQRGRVRQGLAAAGRFIVRPFRWR